MFSFTHTDIQRLALLKKLTNSKDGSHSRIRISVPAFLSLISRFLQCKCQSPLPEQFFGSQAAFETTFIIPGSYLKIDQTSWKRITGRIVRLASDIIDSLFLIFYPKKHPKIDKIVSTHTKVLEWF
jgi:hypothetical protein